MSCILRIAIPNVKAVLPKLSMSPYRVENETSHFDVSDADFDNFKVQIEDAISFLRTNGTDVKLLMREPGASGELDFGIKWRDVASQVDTLPSTLVRLAGELGLDISLSHYPTSEESNANA